MERVSANLTALNRKTGPRYRRWQHAVVASLGGVLLDDARANTQTDGRDA